MEKRNNHRQADAGSSMVAMLRQNRNDEAGSGFPKGPKQSKKPKTRKAKHIPKLKIPPVTAEGGAGSGRHGGYGEHPSVGDGIAKWNKKAIDKGKVKHESERREFKIKTRLREADGADLGGGKYRVVLIQEGLGNLNDCFYYTKESLQNSVDEFEGVKCFADHPNKIEEEVHPERSTRDILGHYEDVEYVENDGRGALEATLVLCEGDHFDWAKSLLTNALAYSKKYSNAEFVGFSINAQGEAGQTDLQEFIRTQDVPNSALPKLEKALGEGVDEIRPVSVLKDAVSVDLVTEAGAGGKILTMMERNQKPMKTKVTKTKKNAREADAKTKKVATREGAGPAADGEGGDEDHADAAQDKALFQKMISQYLGDDSGVDEEEAMGMAQAAHEHFMKQGMEAHEAYEAAGNHLKAAHGIGKMMSAHSEESHEQEEEAESHEEDHDEEAEAEAESHEEEECEDGDAGEQPPMPAKKKGAQPMAQESNKKKQPESDQRLTKALAEIASMKEAMGRMDVRNYLDKKIAGSDRSPEFIKAFREALGKPRSKAHIEETWATAAKFYDAGKTDGGEEADFAVFTENSSSRLREATSDNVISFEDCVE